MQQLDQTTKDEITKLIEIALESIQAKVKNFGEPFQMHHTAQKGDEPEHKWTEVFYPMTLDSSVGELRVSVSSMHERSVWDMVEVVCHHDIAYSQAISQELKDKILTKLYSPEFMALRK